MNNHNQKNQKNILLYIVIGVLSLSLIIVSVFTYFSMTTLSDLRKKISTLQQSIGQMSAEYDEMKSHAEELESLKHDQDVLLNALKEQVQTLSHADTEQSEAPAIAAEPAETAPAQDNILISLMPQLQSMLPGNNGSWSAAVSNLALGSADSINSQRMQAASLIKLYIMGAVYENYNSLSAIYGSGTLDALLSPMITVSDNDAANELVNYLGSGDSSAGMAAVNNYCNTHGYADTHMGRLLLHPNDADDNYTSVDDCCRFLTEVYLGATGQKTLDHADSMYSLLKQQQRQHKIPAGLPSGVHAANKTGELADVENDVAIVYDTASGMDLIICFMSEHLAAPVSAQESIANMTSFIYNSYNS